MFNSVVSSDGTSGSVFTVIYVPSVHSCDEPKTLVSLNVFIHMGGWGISLKETKKDVVVYAVLHGCCNCAEVIGGCTVPFHGAFEHVLDTMRKRHFGQNSLDEILRNLVLMALRRWVLV